VSIAEALCPFMLLVDAAVFVDGDSASAVLLCLLPLVVLLLRGNVGIAKLSLSLSLVEFLPDCLAGDADADADDGDALLVLVVVGVSVTSASEGVVVDVDVDDVSVGVESAAGLLPLLASDAFVVVAGVVSSVVCVTDCACFCSCGCCDEAEVDAEAVAVCVC
jgi:hypothetical protein